MRVCTRIKETEIVEAASRVFTSRPYQEVLMEDIAVEGGFGKGTGMNDQLEEGLAANLPPGGLPSTALD